HTSRWSPTSPPDDLLTPDESCRPKKATGGPGRARREAPVEVRVGPGGGGPGRVRAEPPQPRRSAPFRLRSVKIAVIALGKIGLPLAVQFADKGHEVVGVDINANVVDLVNRAVEPFPGEAHLQEKLSDL